jgi:hypothetical protein
MAKPRIDAAGIARRAKAVELRRARFTFAEIGKELNVNASRAFELYTEGLRVAPVANVEQHRTEEMELIDAATKDLLLIARDHGVSDRTRVEAWSAIRGWAERKSRLLGLDAAVKFEDVTATEDGRDAELRQMIDDAKAKILAEQQAAENGE